VRVHFARDDGVRHPRQRPDGDVEQAEGERLAWAAVAAGTPPPWGTRSYAPGVTPRNRCGSNVSGSA